ncbi:MAG: MFS transporter [Candidatus Hodarchaeota archaeon]
MHSPTRIVNMYYLFVFIRGLRFLVPIWTLYLNDLGYDIFTITVLDVIFFVTIAIAEIPTGTIADKVSRKLSLLIGVLLYIIGITVFVFAINLWVLVFAYIIWAIGMTFWSGADQAFLYDSLKSSNREHEFQQIYGKAIFLDGAAMAFASIIGGFLASFSLRLPFLLTALACLFSGLILLFIPEERPTDELAKGKYAKHVLDTIQLIKNSRILALLLVFSVIFAVMGVIEFVFRQLYLKGELDVSIFVIGVLYALMMILGALGAMNSFRLNKLLGDRLFLAFQVGIIGTCFFLFSIAILWVSVPFLLFYAYFGSVFYPFFTRLVNEEVPSEKRATAFSLAGVVITGSAFVFELLAGYLATQTSISFSYFILSSFFFAVCIVPLILWIRTPLKGP